MEADDQDLDAIKDMLKNILTIHIENDQEHDQDLKATLESLLTQITEDDGALTFEELSQIHMTIKSLLEGDANASSENDSDVEVSDSDESSRSRRKKRKRAEPRSSKEELRTSKKKRKHPGEGRRKRRHRDAGFEGSSSFERSREDEKNLAEVEAGEIDDVYDEEFIVEKEFEDLLLKNNGHSNLSKKMSNPVQSQGQAMQYAEVNNDI